MRALEWHSRGQRFDPAYLHHKSCAEYLIIDAMSCDIAIFVLNERTNLKPSKEGSSWKGRTGENSGAFEPVEKAERCEPVLTQLR